MLQEKILDELGNEMDSTSHRLDFVQVSFCYLILMLLVIKSLNIDMCKLKIVSLRLWFQKRVAMVMKKASVKGQMMMLCALLALFIFLFILVFFT